MENAILKTLMDFDAASLDPARNVHYVFMVEEFKDRKRIIVEQVFEDESVRFQKKLMEVEVGTNLTTFL